MSKLQGLRAAIAFLALASSATMAERLKPPTVVLGEPTTTIVVADYKEAGPADRIVFAKVKVLQSRDVVPDLIDVGKPDLRAPLIAGKRYILAYTPYAENRLEQIVVNPRGATFVSSSGMEPALWTDSAEHQSLVMWRIDGPESEDEGERESETESAAAKQAMPRLLKTLRSDDWQLAEFAAAEIAMRPALIATLDDAEQKVLQRFVANATGPDRARAALLSAAAQMPRTAASTRGWDAIAGDLLAKTAVQTLGVDRRSALILAALAYPPTQQRDSEGRLRARWLRSDDQALVDSAANGLMETSVTQAMKEIGAALSEESLPADNRLLLEGYQRRLELLESRSRAK